MAKFSDIKKGRRARKTISFPIGEEIVKVDVRVIGPDEDIDIAVEAAKYARSKGVENPGPGHDVYDKAERAFTLLRGCVDWESPQDAPAPFFSNVEEILTADVLARDHIAYLIEEQLAWQDACSPRRRELNQADYISLVAKSAEGDIGPFALLAPGAQVAFVLTMASQLFASLTPKSPYTSPSPESGS